MPTDRTNLIKSTPLILFERILLVLCLAVIFIRTFFTESPNVQASDLPLALGDNTLTLAISALLIFSFISWLVLAVFSSGFSYRFTGIELPLVIFIVASAIGISIASNVRVAINETVTIIAPIFMAILLIQLLNTRTKIKTCLYIIASLGIISAIYCAAQVLLLNDVLIQKYQTDPNSILEQFAIRAGSFQQMLFEHSLASRDVRGFFVTGNSAGSFAILTSFAAFALFIQNRKNPRSRLRTKSLIPAMIVLVNILGLILTHSKGAAAAFTLTAGMCGLYYYFGYWIRDHKKTVLIAVLLLFVIVVTGIIAYGTTHDRLPGGNSTLVRWQYWNSSAKMYADNYLTGIGPGNFGYYYSHYKNPAALETVADPHNFLLGIITQFGPLGLVAFLAAVFIPLLRIYFTRSSQTDPLNSTKAILSLSLLGFLLHNCVDFAIFEPAITTVFWTLLAVIIAADLQINPRAQVIKTPSVLLKTSTVIGAVAAVWLYVTFITPALKAGEKIGQTITQPLFTNTILEQASAIDPLDPIPFNLNGRNYLQQYHSSIDGDAALLEKAAENFLAAIERNNADFKNYEKLSQTYQLLCQNEKAYEYAAKAVKRYPGSARLRIELAQLAESLGKNDVAIQQYKKAVQIEEAYREQFKIMYPGKKIFSRIGEQKYQKAKIASGH
ncbi:O-antigen ligase family protein [Planctomycetota bacterium]